MSNFEDDYEALMLLDRRGGWNMRGGLIRPTHEIHKAVGLDEYAAIDYLCDEWDFGYVNLQQPRPPHRPDET